MYHKYLFKTNSIDFPDLRETKIPEIHEIRRKPFSTYHVYHMYIFKTNSIDSPDLRETPSLFRVIPAIRGA